MNLKCYRCCTWPCECKDGQTIIHGDCREVLPLLGSVDATVTSPPYNTLPGSNNPSGFRARRKSGVDEWISRVSKGYADSRPEDEYQKWLVKIIGKCIQLSRGLVWVNHKIRYRNGIAIHPARMLPWDIYTEVIWDRGGSLALNCKRYAPSTEHLLAFGRPHVWHDDFNGLMSVWRMGYDRDDNEHPCSYPVEIASRPIASSTNPNDTVLDPFAGSGTTLVAAKQLGRKGVGIEIEERYVEIAANRLRQEVLQFTD